MQNVISITNDIVWVGGNDRRLALFENAFPIDRGVSYNSYLILDEKPTLIDTVDKSIGDLLLENIKHALGDRSLAYLVVQHMEPDHSVTLKRVVDQYPQVVVVCNDKTSKMITQFFGSEFAPQMQLVKEGDTLNTGSHQLHFVMAPMVHWPEVMVTYDSTQKVLFSADAFGTFGAISGNLFADKDTFEREWLDDARRYYTNIVGKYGPQVTSLLGKAASLQIDYLCPLHGPTWNSDIDFFVQKYKLWSSYTSEEPGVLILFGSVYGNTENAVDILAAKLAQKGVRNIKIMDASSNHHSYIVAQAFKYSHLVVAAPTYNAGVFTPVEFALNELKIHNVQNKTVALIQNGSWAPTATKAMQAIIDQMKNMTYLNTQITIRSSVSPQEYQQLDTLADEIVASLS